MKIPYGISDFKALREQGYLYIDKTPYIEKLEGFNSKYMFFIRPRRFGKSLFLSTLEQYYDINAQDKFDSLFGDLYIGQNPTALKNSYLVLRLNFSGLKTDSNDNLQKSFNMKVIISISRFINKYQQYIPNASRVIDALNTHNDAIIAFDLLINELQQIEQKIYLIIDEYDNFANDIIAMGDGEFYKEIIRGSGFVREFYKTVKIGTESVIDRIFITGASPIMLDDLTSGFNIAANVTMDVRLNEMLGFSTLEVEGILKSLDLSREEIGINLEEYYNGYLFNQRCSTRVYNPDMLLYYLDNFVATGIPPLELVDENVKTDYGRLERLVRNEDNKKVLEQIIKDECIQANLVAKFSFDTMYDSEYFISLLFSMGMLTIDRPQLVGLVLKIPNYVIKTIYWEYLGKILRKTHNVILDFDKLVKAIETMTYKGSIKPYVDYVTDNVLKQMSNRDLIGFDEKYIKAIMFSHFAGVKVYKPISEKEVENGYIDIYLERDKRKSGVKYEWVIELKYVKESEKDKLTQVKQQGLEQLERYCASRGIVGRNDIKKALVIFIGKDENEVIEN